MKFTPRNDSSFGHTAQTVDYIDSSISNSTKVLRNTYMLLSMTLIFSAVMAGVSLALGVGHIIAIICMVAAMGLSFFMQKLSNSSAGVFAAFGYTGLLGFSLGPILARYLSMAGGGEIVMGALALTGLIFMGLSAYVLISKRDFSFMGGFLMVGILVAFVASIGAMFFNVPAFSVAISGAFVLLMSGLILYETSNIVHGGETNYILATVTLYASIFNLFVSLLQILGFISSDD
jgi:modulator of FtsH protease